MTDTMTDTELDAMILKLQATTAIGRCNLAECRDIFRVLQARHGYTITKPATEAA